MKTKCGKWELIIIFEAIKELAAQAIYERYDIGGFNPSIFFCAYAKRERKAIECYILVSKY
jgi:hypothetical protein